MRTMMNKKLSGMVAIATLALGATACKRDRQSARVAADMEAAEEVPMAEDRSVVPPGDVITTQDLAMAQMTGDDGISGEVRFTTSGSSSTLGVIANFQNVPPGEHVMHVHEKGDCSNFKGGSAGAHWTIGETTHGGPEGPVRHTGDLGNIDIDSNGVGNLIVDVPSSDLVQSGLIGKAVILHAEMDDEKTQPSRASGDPIACGIIKATSQAPAH